MPHFFFLSVTPSPFVPPSYGFYLYSTFCLRCLFLLYPSSRIAPPPPPSVPLLVRLLALGLYIFLPYPFFLPLPFIFALFRLLLLYPHTSTLPLFLDLALPPLLNFPSSSLPLLSVYSSPTCYLPSPLSSLHFFSPPVPPRRPTLSPYLPPPLLTALPSPPTPPSPSPSPPPTPAHPTFQHRIPFLPFLSLHNPPPLLSSLSRLGPLLLSLPFPHLPPSSSFLPPPPVPPLFLFHHTVHPLPLISSSPTCPSPLTLPFPTTPSSCLPSLPHLFLPLSPLPSPTCPLPLVSLPYPTYPSSFSLPSHTYPLLLAPSLPTPAPPPLIPPHPPPAPPPLPSLPPPYPLLPLKLPSHLPSSTPSLPAPPAPSLHSTSPTTHCSPLRRQTADGHWGVSDTPLGHPSFLLGTFLRP
ncbi:hypothetical protein C7M84_003439, partial [Penaeus vannamei]